jgi:hypothetical protein
VFPQRAHKIIPTPHGHRGGHFYIALLPIALVGCGESHKLIKLIRTRQRRKLPARPFHQNLVLTAHERQDLAARAGPQIWATENRLRSNRDVRPIKDRHYDSGFL